MSAPGRSFPARADRSRFLLAGMVDEFAETARLTAGERQVRSMTSMVRQFLWQSSPKDMLEPQQLTAAAVERYLADLAVFGKEGRSPKTLRNHCSALSCFCRFLVKRGMLAANPCDQIRLKRPEQQLPRWLNEKEIATVLKLAETLGIWVEVCIALSTGLRLSELIRLEWLDVDLDRRMLTVRKSKSGRPRVIPLCDAAIKALKSQHEITGQFRSVFPARQTWRGHWRYVDRSRAINWWLRVLQPISAAVPKFHALAGCRTGRGWHLFRHTFASRAAQAGVSVYKLAQWMGHADVRTTQIYAHLQGGFDPEIEAASPLRGPEDPQRKKRRSK